MFLLQYRVLVLQYEILLKLYENSNLLFLIFFSNLLFTIFFFFQILEIIKFACEIKQDFNQLFSRINNLIPLSIFSIMLVKKSKMTLV